MSFGVTRFYKTLRGVSQAPPKGHFMKIPHGVHHFHHSTLLIVSDHVRAHFYLIHEDTLVHADEIIMPRERYQDNEGAAVIPSQGTPCNPKEKSDAPRLHHFIKKMCRKADALHDAHGIEVVDLVMPADLAHVFTDACSTRVHPKIRRTLHHDMMKKDILDVVKKLFEQ